MPSRTATFILIALALVAVIGFGQGLTHAFTGPRPEEASQSVGDPARDPVPAAKALTNAAPALDEARVRQIAREEADAALARSRPKKAPPKEQPDDTADAAAPMPTPKPVEPPPATTPSPPPSSPQ